MRERRVCTSTHEMPRKHVTIASTDGVQLQTVALLHDEATQPVTLLFVHQYRSRHSYRTLCRVVPIVSLSLLGGNMMLMMGMAQRLHEHGYNCVAFNFRGVGRSTGRATLTGTSSPSSPHGTVM